MAIQLNYAYVYLVSGWENEYLARLIPALLSLGTLLTAWVLGRMCGGARAGWAAALLLALTPTFARWASTGYVDLPMAFFYTLSAIFALRLWESVSVRDAALAGMLMGGAAWTKNAALVGVALLAAWLAWGWLNRRVSLRLAVVSMVACALVAAPWYIRNLIGAGFLMPDTAWTEDASASLDNLLILILRPEIYGLSGWLFAVGWLATLVEVARVHRQPPYAALLISWTVPFFLVWWVFASYDPRFILLFLPLLAVMGGMWAVRLWKRLTPRWRKGLSWAGGVLVLTLTLYTVSIAVEFKDELLRDPLMPHDIKQALVRPPSD
jgi:4-amino-4-deoxy-L-arabinose transferase-like glycosyltransferase